MVDTRDLKSLDYINNLAGSNPALGNNKKMFKIITYPNPKLRQKSKKVKKFNKKLKNIINFMFKTMYYFKGIGLAAIQININKSIIVIDTKKKKQKIALINPKIIKKTGSIESQEGCLSIPNFFYPIKRYNNLHIKAKNIYGEKITFKSKGLFSICIQHEIDHTKGKLFVDYI